MVDAAYANLAVHILRIPMVEKRNQVKIITVFRDIFHKENEEKMSGVPTGKMNLSFSTAEIKKAVKCIKNGKRSWRTNQIWTGRNMQQNRRKLQ